MSGCNFEIIGHNVDVCVVGGGLSGLCAAVAAARHGAKVALVQDRPMLGGNASSEIRMWVCGAHGDNNRETGLIEELQLNNLYRNPYKNYSIWDGVMLELAQKEPNLDLFLNCSCMDGAMQGNRLESITCWQLTTQKFHTFRAKIFADCSGDSVLAPITGAMYRMGREASGEFSESIAPVEADKKTMGMSCLIQAREYTEPRTFIAPDWARKFTKDDLPYRIPNLQDDGENFWYMEIGGTSNMIDDTEVLRDELLRIAYGIWDFIKNDPENAEKYQNFDIDWIGILPGKRESRRYVGDHILTQNDVASGGRFDDIIAYGGWSMDDHNPGGIDSKEVPTVFHPAPSPYGIPYRCVYSKNVDNLMFAGRNISVTHSAMSSTRVMATCALLGQAVGTAAAMATASNRLPRDICGRIDELQQTLMLDDCYLPFTRRDPLPLCELAVMESNFSDPACLYDGVDRPVNGKDHGSRGGVDAYATYRFSKSQFVDRIRLVFDSDLNRETLPEWEHKLNRPMRHNILLGREPSHLPITLIRDFEVEIAFADGNTEMRRIDNNHQRLIVLPVGAEVHAVTFRPHATWGSKEFHLFAFELL